VAPQRQYEAASEPHLGCITTLEVETKHAAQLNSQRKHKWVVLSCYCVESAYLSTSLWAIWELGQSPAKTEVASARVIDAEPS
jgi:hypothetical protein